MGKLKDLAAVSMAESSSFVYMPPPSAYGAGLILVKPSLASLAPPPATVSMSVLGAVLRGLRRASPKGRIVIVESSAEATPIYEIYEQQGVMSLLDAEMRVGDADHLIMADYRNRLPQPIKFASLTAPVYLRDYNCVISVSSLQQTPDYIGASLKNLDSLLPRSIYPTTSLTTPSVAAVLKDIYFSIGQYIHGAVVDLGAVNDSSGQAVGKVVWGTDLLAVDESACRLAGLTVADYLTQIRALQKSV